MTENELIQTLFAKYTTKEETVFRLPLDAKIDDVWEAELEYRKKQSKALPLHSYKGDVYWYVPTDKIINAGNKIVSMANNDSLESVFSYIDEYGTMDEAYYSSAIEGAHSTKKEAREFIFSGSDPKTKDEQMIYNNYKALQFVIENLDSSIREETIIEINRILTEKTLDDNYFGYRNDDVFVVSHTGEIIYKAPDKKYISSMMEELIRYLNNENIHPVEKAAVSHIYFVTIHPFFDGNGRTARALSYMILLKAGYNFFRHVPISGLLANDRAKYYKSIRASQNPVNGYDFTYFVEYYISMLEATLESAQNRLQRLKRLNAVMSCLDEEKDVRALNGARWMISENVEIMTSEKWRKKFEVSFETARKDLILLERSGFLKKTTKGRKDYYEMY